VPWSDCRNKNIFNDPPNQEYDNSAFRKSAGKLFHTLVAAAAKVLSPKQLEVRWTVSVLMSAECSSLARAYGLKIGRINAPSFLAEFCKRRQTQVACSILYIQIFCVY